MRSRVLVAAAAGLLAGAAVPTLAATSSTSSMAPVITEVAAQQPTSGTVTVHGCYNSVGTMKSNGTLQFCSLGSCGQVMCRDNGWLVGATMGSNYCYCGNEYPNPANLVADENCNITCAGYDEICGGINFYTVYNTGLNLVVPVAPPDESVLSSSSSTSSSSTATSTTQSIQAVTESAKSDSSTKSDSSKSSTNVAGIAAGVGVAVVVVALALGAMFFYMRSKRNTEIEAAHRSATAASHLSQSHKSGGSVVSYDTRLEQDMVHRRMSCGSINDNEDYSRRILRVTNA